MFGVSPSIPAVSEKPAWGSSDLNRAGRGPPPKRVELYHFPAGQCLVGRRREKERAGANYLGAISGHGWFQIPSIAFLPEPKPTWEPRPASPRVSRRSDLRGPAPLYAERPHGRPNHAP